MRLAFRNLLRRKVRTAFALLGIAIGIGAVVSMVSVTRGLQRQFKNLADQYQNDLVVTGRESLGPLMSRIPPVGVDAMRAVPGIENASTLRIHGLRLKDYSGGFLVLGMVPGEPFLDRYEIVAGRMLSEEPKREIIIGKVAAEELGLKAGDPLYPESEGAHEIEPYEVVGIFEAEHSAQAGFLSGQGIVHGDYLDQENADLAQSMIRTMLPAMLMSMGTSIPKCSHCEKPFDARSLSGLLENMPKLVQTGGANLVVLHLREDAEMAATIGAFEADERFGAFKIQSGQDYVGSFKQFDLIDRFAWGISLIAALVGAIGVANTMIMSVFERTREIGLLRAVGWSKGMIVKLIVWEGLILSIVGGVLGVVFGLMLELVASRLILFGWIEVYLDFPLFGQAILLAAVLGVGGSIYPGLRAASLSPTEALRYE